MSTADIKTSKWLEDFEIRSEYGSATFKYDIAAALVAARKMKNLTQVALANIAGVSQAYIAKLESGEANPTIGRIGAVLASIWLKSEIKPVPIVPSFDDEIAELAEENTTTTVSRLKEVEQPQLLKPPLPCQLPNHIVTALHVSIKTSGIQRVLNNPMPVVNSTIIQGGISLGSVNDRSIALSNDIQIFLDFYKEMMGGKAG